MPGFVLKRILKYLLAALIILIIWNWDMVLYGLRQGVGQAKILWNARPIETVLADPTFPDSSKMKLLLTGEMRAFAMDSLGLKNSDNYTTVYDQKGKAILWVVTGCEEFSLEPYKWSYPFLGDLGYMGFFDTLLAAKEEARLKDLGYDTDLDIVQAWSTLGWFKDPILSNMLDRSEGMLARLICHELTHATIYIKSDAEFNENLATFVGNIGGERYIIAKYGLDSPQHIEYRERLSDVDVFVEAILKGSEEMKAFYDQLDASLPIEDKRKFKKDKLIEVQNSLWELDIKHKDRFSFYDRDSLWVNNTLFTDVGMYRNQQEDIERVFTDSCDSNIESLLEYYKEKYD